MADLLQVDVVQQLEVALIGSPTTQVIDLLSGGLMQSTASTSVAMTSTSVTPVQPHPRSYTSTPPAPPPPSVPVLGISSPTPATVLTMASLSDVVEPVVLETKEAKISDVILHWCITPTLAGPSSTVSTTSLLASTNISTLPIVVVPELAIPDEAYSECINRPGGGKDYLCHLSPFRHSNLDSILTHVRKHLEVIIGCLICSKGYQNTASPHKHGRDVHSVQITSTTPLSGVIPKEQI